MIDKTLPCKNCGIHIEAEYDDVEIKHASLVWCKVAKLQLELIEAKRAVNLGIGALQQLSPCMNEECQQEQKDWLDTALKELRAISGINK